MRVYAAVLAMISLITGTHVNAQYMFSMPGEDDHDDSIRYFGSARDQGGVLLSDVIIEIETSESNYVFVTNELGRFRGHLPLGMSADKIKARCSRPGFQSLRVMVRPGPAAPKPTVQVDCVLRPAK